MLITQTTVPCFSLTAPVWRIGAVVKKSLCIRVCMEKLNFQRMCSVVTKEVTLVELRPCGKFSHLKQVI